MKHVSIVINPREAGLKPYRVSFHRPESMPVKSRLDEGIIYRHPECAETATVWGESEEAVADVLTTTKGGNEAT
jgi:hypothetical protein